MRKRKLLLLLICLVGGLGMAVGQTLQVRGIVVSGDNDEPVIGASVVVQGGRNAGVITDFEGRFSLKVEAGAARLCASPTSDARTSEAPPSGASRRSTTTPLRPPALSPKSALSSGRTRSSARTGAEAGSEPP